MIYCKDWRGEYSRLVDDVFSQIDGSKLWDVSIGSFRISQDYLKKMGMNANKLETVKLIGSRVESPEKLLERLEELRTIIQEKVSDKDCPFILSTMHASKGLEYDTVYLLDVMDGILPEKVLANPRTASKE